MERLRQFVRDQEGVAAVEYALLASLISLAAVTAMAGVGNQLADTFNRIERAMAGNVGARERAPSPLP